MTRSRTSAEPWLSEYGAETPTVLREWAAQLASAPRAAALLEEAAAVAETILCERENHSHDARAFALAKRSSAAEPALAPPLGMAVTP